jgi:BirA family transcriptional regulator, biotin operon repressor / biotin---[acetyl-CoA-carboxylase] ligase
LALTALPGNPTSVDVDDIVPDESRWSRIEHLEEVGSTNAVVMERARRGEPPGLVVVADHQTAGRGRRGRTWTDEPGASLLMSALLASDLPRPTLAPLATGLAVRDALRELGAHPTLKWPNDVLLNGAKCAGILVESLARPARIVIGIGVNVDWRAVGGAEARWTSVAEHLGGGVERGPVLGHLLAALDARLSTASRDPDALLGAYRDVCSTLGAAVEVTVGDGVIVGSAEDVDRDGALVVRTGERSVVVRAGDVEHVRTPVEEEGSATTIVHPVRNEEPSR